MRWVLVFALSGCAIARRPLELPDNREATVMLLTGTLGPPMNDIARHPWFAARKAGEREWQIYEVPNLGVYADPFHDHGYGDPILHKVWRGAVAERAADCLAAHAQNWIESHSYVFYPGPNSNTFGAAMLRTCKLAASLPATSIGKDWHGLIGGGLTTERTGLELHTPIAGVRVGLKEGIQVHVLGLEFGIDLWPPALIVPFGPGRIGFADR